MSQSSPSPSSWHSTAQSRTHQRQIKLQQIVLAIAKRLGTNLSDGAVEAVLDLLHCGVPPDSILAVLEQLQQEKMLASDRSVSSTNHSSRFY